jgi:formylglycine-generating enzyme required for sulfatase activity
MYLCDNIIYMSKPLKTFIIYARKDEAHKQELVAHLKSTLVVTGHLEIWEDSAILPGEEWEKIIEQHLRSADLFLVLLSVDALNSSFIQKTELKTALQKKSRIVPILVRSCFWQGIPIFAGLQGLPKNMKAITSFTHSDDAWTEIVEALHEMVESIRKEQVAPPPIATPPPVPQPKPQPNISDDGLVFVKGGTFTMGCTSEQKDCRSDEHAHQVTLSDFYIGKYEVTQKEWTEIMGDNPSHFKNGDNYPVERVSWDDIQTFLSKLNTKYPNRDYRLPTEAEWEYAARGGGKEVLFGNGKNVLDPKEANFNTNTAYKKPYSVSGEYRKKTTPVGSFAPNALGLYDMSGNVWEWCSDWYGSDYYKNSPATNPQGPTSGSDRVLRGGSFLYDPQNCRVSSRSSLTPDYRAPSVGFRLARTK